MPQAYPARDHRAAGGVRTIPCTKARRLLRTGAGLVSDKGWERLEQLFADPHNTPEHTTWAVYQKIMSAYRAKTPFRRQDPDGQGDADPHHRRA